ncbi:MAG: hypothetical protein RLZ98_2454 [Pseudomonadota bacterium]|jgi:hypothetical protein
MPVEALNGNLLPPAPARAPLETQLKRYQRSFRRRLRKFAKTSVAVGDLVYTFPALAIVIATGQGAQERRNEAIVLAAEGRSLRQVAAAVGLPMWLRKLPPEAFGECVPQVPASELFAHRIVNAVPAEDDAARMWLAWVVSAWRLAGEEFAMWIAGQRIYSARGLDAHCVWPLAAYAWFSGHDGATARGFIRRPWKARMSFAHAVEETRGFVLRLMLEECRDDSGVEGRWHSVQRASGYRIVPLRTPADLEQEGDRMNNCVASYVQQVAKGECLIYGIRRGNRHVATLEIRAHLGEGGRPVITQLEGPGNGPAADDVWRAVQKWLSRQGRFPVVSPRQLAGVAVNAERWVALWEPYWKAVGQQAAHRQVPVASQLAHLNHSLEHLVALAKLRE